MPTYNIGDDDAVIFDALEGLVCDASHPLAFWGTGVVIWEEERDFSISAMPPLAFTTLLRGPVAPAEDLPDAAPISLVVAAGMEVTSLGSVG